MNEKRVGFVGIIIKDRKQNAPAVNNILTEFGDTIVGRIGMPYERRKLSVIALIVDGTSNEIGALTGKLGMIKGVTVKSAMAKENE
jgi:putative iron-only hydrogenase system regulator